MSGLAAAGARGGMVTVLSQVVTVALRMGLLVVLARLVAPSVFGVVTIAQAIAAFATSLALLGLGMAAAQAVDLSQNAQSVLSHAQTALGAVLGAAILLLAGPLASAYDHDSLEGVMRWLALVPLLQGLQSQLRIRLVRDLRFGALAMTEVVSLVGSAVVAVALAVADRDYQAVVAQVLVQPFLQLLLLLGVTRWLPSLRVRLDREVREVLAVGGRILVMNLSRNAARSALTPVMGLAVPVSALGQFDRAQQLSTAPVALTVDKLQQVAVPVLSRLRDEPARAEQYLARAQLLTVHLSGTGFLLLAALSPDLVEVVLGERWHLAGVVFAVLCLGSVFRILGEAVTWVFISAGATREGVRMGLWTQPAVVAVSLLGLPWGVVGVAVANSVAWLLYWPVAHRLAARAAGYSSWGLPRHALGALLRLPVPVAAGALVVHRATAGGVGHWSLVLALGSVLVTVPALLALPGGRRDLAAVRHTVALALGRG